MNVSELMTTSVKSCGLHGNDLHRAAQMMWESDCGALPVLDADNRVVGMITDRDICMAAYTQSPAPLADPGVSAMANKVHGIRETDPVEMVETLMRRVRVGATRSRHPWPAEGHPVDERPGAYAHISQGREEQRPQRGQHRAHPRRNR